MSCNCQNFKGRANDLTDRVFQHVNVSILPKTFMKNYEPSVAVHNLNFVI